MKHIWHTARSEPRTHMQLQMQNTVFLTESDPRWPQQSWPWVWQAGESLHDAFCPKTTMLKPPVNHHNIFHQNHEVQ